MLTVTLKRPSQRMIAQELGLSVATVCRALHNDPRVHPATRRRVSDALKKHNYELDPDISSSLTKVRRQNIYSETIAWCGDENPKEMRWLADLFSSMEEFAARIGYKIEYFKITETSTRALNRLVSIWQSRGIRGVLLGPMRTVREELPFPWESSKISWVSLGATFQHPGLHNAGRDYNADIQLALRWLASKGARRPGFLANSSNQHVFTSPMLHTAVAQAYERENIHEPLFLEYNHGDIKAIERWVSEKQLDSIISPMSINTISPELNRKFSRLPVAILSSTKFSDSKYRFHINAEYKAVGAAAVSMLQRLIINRETGIPAYHENLKFCAINQHAYFNR